MYEVTKTLQCELKPSKETFKKLEKNELFKSKSFTSKIFIHKNNKNVEPEKKVNNYLFKINESELNNLVKNCDEKIKGIKNIKEFLENNPDELWKIWIDNEKIKIIDKDLKYILQEKKSWKKSCWNEKKENDDGTVGFQSDFTVEWRKGLLGNAYSNTIF